MHRQHGLGGWATTPWAADRMAQVERLQLQAAVDGRRPDGKWHYPSSNNCQPIVLRLWKMRVLIFEFVMGGGFFSLPDQPLPTGSLLEEGAAMAAALVSDLARLSADIDLTVFRDHRLRSLVDWPNSSFQDVTSDADVKCGLSQASDVAIVIAPSREECCERHVSWLDRRPNCCWTPPDEFLAWAANKHETVSWLSAHNVPCPAGQLVCDREQTLSKELMFPLVAKPNDGCGSQGVTLVRCRDQLDRVVQPGTAWRVEQYIGGRPASVAAICGQGQVHWLQPCWQLLNPPDFTYNGCRLVDEPDLQHRAWRLVKGLDVRLSHAVGFVGVDIVLGEPVDGSADYVIEVNPRLTTSYVCLSRSTRKNLLEAMIRLAQPRPVLHSSHSDSSPRS